MVFIFESFLISKSVRAIKSPLRAGLMELATGNCFSSSDVSK